METEPVIDMLIVGAGLAGVGAAVRFRRDLPGREMLILERRQQPGGTWDLFRYPGVRSDSDMFTLGFDFRPWTGAKSIADGESIRRYVQDTVRDEGLEPCIRYGRRVVACDWSSADAVWRVRHVAEDGSDACVTAARFLYMAAGYYDYDAGYMPEFAGRADFGGTVIHPQHWPQAFDPRGRRIVVIGSGATAVTLIPALADAGAEVTMLQRSPTWMISRPARDRFADIVRRLLPDKLAYGIVRARNIFLGRFFFRYARRKPAKVAKHLLAEAGRLLPPGYDLATHMTPRYNPWEERLCLVPDGDFFAAIRSGRARIETGHIDRFVPEGIRLADGRTLAADTIVAATGLQLALAGKAALSVDGVSVESGRLVSYKGLMFSGLPNYIQVFGYTNASWTLKADLCAAYAVRLTRALEQRRADYAVAEADPAMPTEPMTDFSSGYFRRAEAILPRQGTAAPWRLNQDYYADRRILLKQPIADGVLRFGRAGDRIAVPAPLAAE